MKNKLKEYRFFNNRMTQEELAKRCGIVRQTVIAIEKGSFNPSVKLALKICRVLGTTIEEVFLLEEEDLA